MGPLGPSWSVGKASWAVLEAFWAVVAPSWAVLGLSWRPLGPSLGDLGCFLGRLGASGRGRGENAKIAQQPKGINVFGLLGPFWEASWRPLGASWRPRGPSGSHLGCLGPIVRRLGALLDRLGRLLGPTWSALGRLKAAPRRNTISDPNLPGTCRGPGRGIFRPGTPRGGPARAN